MTETTNNLPGQPVDGVGPDDIDDVEAHGLREVAAAAGIGAAVIGAGGVALAAGHSSNPTPGPRTPAIVQQAMDDTRQLSGDATQGALGLASDARADADVLTGHTVTAVNNAVDPTVQSAKSDVQGVTATTVNLAGAVAGYATETAGSAVDLTTATAGSATNLATRTAGNALHVATTTAGAAVDTATTTAGKTVNTATTKVAHVEQSAINIVSATVDQVGKGWDLSLTILGDNVTTDGTTLMPTGTIAVKDATGHTLASAKVVNGKAKVHLSAIGQNRTVTIHYGGDSHFAASTLQWQAPVGF